MLGSKLRVVVPVRLEELMRERNKGFTLVELLVAITIIAVSLSLALPGFQGMVARNRISTQVNDFLTAINLARSEAMRRGSFVSIQSVDNGAVADNEFGNGYCVQIGQPGAAGFSTSCTYLAAKCDDVPGDDTKGKSITGCVVRTFPALADDDRLNSKQNVSSLTFGGLGELSTGATRDIDLCVVGQDGRRVHIALIGRAKSHRVDDPDASKQPEC